MTELSPFIFWMRKMPQERRNKRKQTTLPAGPCPRPPFHPARECPASPPPAAEQPSPSFRAQLSQCWRHDNAIFNIRQRGGVFLFPCPLPGPRRLSRASSLVRLEAHASGGRGWPGVQLGLGGLRPGADELTRLSFMLI